MRLASLLAVTLAAALTGCGSSSSTPATTSAPTPPTGNATIEFHVTGGIAGVNQELKIDPEGRGTVTTHYREVCNTNHCSSRGSVAPLRLTSAELAALRDKLTAADIGHLPAPPPSGCSDCFEYSLDYVGQHYEADQISIPKTLEPAIAALTKLISEHTAGSGPSISGK